MARDGLKHRLPLKDFDVEMTLPRELTEPEAIRVCALVKSLVPEWETTKPNMTNPKAPTP